MFSVGTKLALLRTVAPVIHQEKLDRAEYWYPNLSGTHGYDVRTSELFVEQWAKSLLENGGEMSSSSSSSSSVAYGDMLTVLVDYGEDVNMFGTNSRRFGSGQCSGSVSHKHSLIEIVEKYEKHVARSIVSKLLQLEANADIFFYSQYERGFPKYEENNSYCSVHDSSQSFNRPLLEIATERFLEASATVVMIQEALTNGAALYATDQDPEVLHVVDQNHFGFYCHGRPSSAMPPPRFDPEETMTMSSA